MRRQLKELAQWLNADGQMLENSIVTGVSIDTRTIAPGDLFIPFRGEQVNGHRFVRQAFEKGAAASLWLKDEPDAPQDLPLIFVDDAEKALQQIAKSYRYLLDCKIIGVTGSNGKTSTKDLIAGVLSPHFKVKKTEGNFNNELGLPLTLLSLEEDTEVAVLEMGMSGFGEISFLSEMAEPHFAVITNIGEAHMQDLGSREGIAKAKFEIIDGLQDGGILFYDGDEPLLKPFVESANGLFSVSFGHQNGLDLSITDLYASDEGSRFTISGKVNGTFTIPVYGSHQVKNALAAILIANELGMTADQIRESLKNCRLTDMRMQPVLADNGALYINDAYNAAPTSMSAALNFLKETALRSEKWVVLGDMLELGDDERYYHESIADQLGTLSLNGILLYGPRMKWLFEKLQQSGQPNVYWSETDIEPIVNVLSKDTNENSIVLLKGSRGVELERVLDGMLAK
ncbi:UDP-N-acetylmuramoyl-tripeptide--D-alanyl-D-alanine ligase [Sporosarcina contaminans]|uniref:UDP-N-acetylmuramoyl-tripeptide--D-alanyl-D-alanine ligase n=1 Tax=Sporosarcina contaminans TaxID=633403 RepID=A0ABW3TV15_9BACL